jgi:hypothetical protein
MCCRALSPRLREDDLGRPLLIRTHTRMKDLNAGWAPPEDEFQGFILDVIFHGLDLMSALGELVTLVSEYQIKLGRILGAPTLHPFED